MINLTKTLEIYSSKAIYNNSVCQNNDINYIYLITLLRSICKTRIKNSVQYITDLRVSKNYTDTFLK
ncbi:hypothetical protein NARC_60157 [Candidatus Nitrosocosmicus arcticus]|uniref:Uncharacterized protein n=1 Tax=Candidatus Nitrosocosmicus arcticus TaxID=2035267 RepID=A0A557SVZ2_9ARCH|nr:hypothetical protein NARC_60157 [Candidatus Nitrosocosmicus arcticus]